MNIDLDRVPEALDVERAVVAEVLQQVDAREVARRVVEVHVLASTGCDALMRPVFDAVCQRLIVVSNCMPGSAHSHADCAIWRMRSRAFSVFTGVAGR